MRRDPASFDEGFEVLARSPRRLSRRVYLVLLAVVVLVAAAAGIHRLTEHDRPVRITAYGQPVADPGAVLAAAQQRFESYTAGRRGALGPDARCWFQRPAGSPDIGSALLCGPVLFYDGDPSAPYLSFPLIAHGTASPVRLAAATLPATAEPAAAPAGTTLVRPEGTAQPVQAADIAAPVPPPAAADTLTATDTVHPADLLRAPSSAVIGADLSTVWLDQYGPVADFGSGSAERSAAPGTQLFAFRLVFTGGENGFARLSTIHLGVSVGGAAPRPMHLPFGGFPQSGQLFVLAAPPTALLNLVLTDQGVTQRLSLRDGTPAPGNIALLQGGSGVDAVPATTTGPATLTIAGHRTPTDVQVGFNFASQEFFVPGCDVHPDVNDHVFLYLNLFYAVAQLRGVHVFSTAELTLTPRGGRAQPVRWCGDEPLFDVPADLTDATLTVTSADENGAGYQLSITKPMQLRVHLTTLP